VAAPVARVFLSKSFSCSGNAGKLAGEQLPFRRKMAA
jgi:hypothetical protein